MAPSNPVKLLWRIGLLLYGLSGGPPQSNETVAADQRHAGPLADEQEILRQQKRSRELEAKRVQLELEVQQLELELQLKRLQLLQVELQQEIDRARKAQQEIDRLRKQERSRPQPLNDLQQRAAALLPQDALGTGHLVPQAQLARPTGAGKPWHVDSHGIIRDPSNYPVGVWGVDGDVHAGSGLLVFPRR